MKTYSLTTDAFTAQYDYLAQLSDDRWAWEYARRSARFRDSAAAQPGAEIADRSVDCARIRLLKSRVPQTRAAQLGLVFLPDPALTALEADVVWTRQAFPSQIGVFCTPLPPGRRCGLWDEVVASCDITHVTDYAGREYLLIRRDGAVLQVRCAGLSLLGLEPVRLHLTVSEIAGFEEKVKVQRAALKLVSGGMKPPPGPVLWNKRTQILRDGIIALDCLEMGLPRRMIAEVLHGEAKVAQEWNGPSLKDAMRYLVRKAQGLRDGGYMQELLRARDGAESGPGLSG